MDMQLSSFAFENKLYQKCLTSITRNIQKIHLHLYQDTKLERITICTKPCWYVEVHYEIFSAKLYIAISTQA
jgi:hypothetical protein